MADSPREFFRELGERGAAAPAGEPASYRFDVDGVGSWRVELADGRVSVEESDAPADCVIGADERTFMRVMRGEASPMTAFMTGKIRVEGDLGLALKLRDLFG